MAELKESKKEELPLSFLTAFVSKGWDEVGMLKEQVKAIREQFTGTKKVEELMQGLIDAYLVCIGQMELHMDKKDYLEYPEDSNLGTKTNDLKEDFDYRNDDVELEDDTTIDEVPTAPAKVVEKPFVKDEFDDDLSAEKPERMAMPGEDFEYFCDFGEPDLTEPKLTDKDLYPED